MTKKNGESTLQERNTDSENLSETTPRRFFNYLCVFYPEDERHMRILHMLERYPLMYRLCYILHCNDCYSQKDIDKWLLKHDTCDFKVGDTKKPHIHCLIKLKTSMTISAMSKTVGGLHVEVCHDVSNSLRYFLHDTPESWDKFQYDSSKLCGDSKLIGLCAQRNSYYIQLQRLCELFDCEHGLKTVINFVAENPAYQDTFERFQYLIVACNTDERSRSVSASNVINNLI